MKLAIVVMMLIVGAVGQTATLTTETPTDLCKRDPMPATPKKNSVVIWEDSLAGVFCYLGPDGKVTQKPRVTWSTLEYRSMEPTVVTDELGEIRDLQSEIVALRKRVEELEKRLAEKEKCEKKGCFVLTQHGAASMTFCIMDKEPIPEDRDRRGAATCSKRCQRLLRAHRRFKRAEVERDRLARVEAQKGQRPMNPAQSGLSGGPDGSPNPHPDSYPLQG